MGRKKQMAKLKSERKCKSCGYGFFFPKGTFDAHTGKPTRKDELYCAEKNRFLPKKEWSNGCEKWGKK